MAPFAIVELDRTVVLLESGEVTKSLVVRAPTSGELHAVQEACDRDPERTLAIFYGLADLDLATVQRFSPINRQRLDDAISKLMLAALARNRH